MGFITRIERLGNGVINDNAISFDLTTIHEEARPSATFHRGDTEQSSNMFIRGLLEQPSITQITVVRNPDSRLSLIVTKTPEASMDAVESLVRSTIDHPLKGLGFSGNQRGLLPVPGRSLQEMAAEFVKQGDTPPRAVVRAKLKEIESGITTHGGRILLVEFNEASKHLTVLMEENCTTCHGASSPLTVSQVDGKDVVTQGTEVGLVRIFAGHALISKLVETVTFQDPKAPSRTYRLADYATLEAARANKRVVGDAYTVTT